MSTYLVAFVVGPLEATEAVDVDGTPSVWSHTAGKERLTAFALEAGAHALRFLHQYFDQPYPGDKLDLVAIPDFAFGAMENLGCMTFREVALLDRSGELGPQTSSRRVASVVEHEIAHMWFGDLVTMGWWNGIWLNEAFATYMALCCLDDFKPEYQCWVGFSRDREMALSLDGLHTTRPIEFPVRHARRGRLDVRRPHLREGRQPAADARALPRHGTLPRRRAPLPCRPPLPNTETTDLWDAIEASGRRTARSARSWTRGSSRAAIPW